MFIVLALASSSNHQTSELKGGSFEPPFFYPKLLLEKILKTAQSL
jgi:hypothetical protein